jgi:hypothetical protein
MDLRSFERRGAGAKQPMADLTVSEFDTPANDMPKPVKEKKKVKQPEKLEVRLARRAPVFIHLRRTFVGDGLAALDYCGYGHPHELLLPSEVPSRETNCTSQ